MRQWLEERTPWGALVGFLRRKTVPSHRYTFWYLFGGLSLLFFIIQFVSGMLLTLYYSPTPDTAHESIRMINNEVSFGWLVRSVHHWSAHLLVIMMFIHLAGKYFFQAYRKPRELTWMSGIVLLGLILSFAFTGYLLPWNTIGYFATQIGTEIPRSLPVVGPILVDVLRGGEFIDAGSLTRIFSLHAIILPVVSLIIVAFHIIQNQYTGSVAPKGVINAGIIPFYPDFLYRDAIAWIGGLLLLFSMVMIFPVQVGEKAEILSTPPPGIRPEWYFLPLFQTIRMLPGIIMGMNTEIFINFGVMFLVVLSICLPWLHTENSSLSTDRFVRIVGVSGIFYFIITMIFGWIN